jgi:hypothetical protein
MERQVTFGMPFFKLFSLINSVIDKRPRPKAEANA